MALYGSVVLIGGDPGIGKSTLILQVLENLNHHSGALYVSGEESAEQISDRAKRIGVKEDILILSETHLEKILSIAKQAQPRAIVIDSIQTIYSDFFDFCTWIGFSG